MVVEEAGAPNDPGSHVVRSMYARPYWSTRESPVSFTHEFSEATLHSDASATIIDQMNWIWTDWKTVDL